jgi:ribosome-associated protein
MSGGDADDGLRVRGFEIPESELEWRFEPSGGPGGQHANRSNTRAILSFDVMASSVFDDQTRTRIVERLGPRAEDGLVRISVDETRSQWRNRSIARRRLADLLDEALRPRGTRKRTRPTRASRERRLRAKKRRSEKKRLRKPPDW